MHFLVENILKTIATILLNTFERDSNCFIKYYFYLETY